MAQQDLERAFSSGQNDVSTIVSIYPLGIDETKPGLIPSQFIIPVVKDPFSDFELLHVHRARFPVYLDENRPALVVPAPSDEVCASICRDFMVGMSGYEPNVSSPGIFWVPGRKLKASIKAEHADLLENARMVQLEWFKRIIAQADDDWSQYQKRRMVSPIQRIAARLLKLDKPWTDETRIEEALAMAPCKFCKADLKAGAIICQFCRGILDMKAYNATYVEAGVVANPK